MPGRGRMQYKRLQMNESGRQIASENQIVRVVRTVVIQPYRTSELNESCSLNSKWQAVSYVSQPMWSDHQKGYQGRGNLAKGSTGDYQKQLCVCVLKRIKPSFRFLPAIVRMLNRKIPVLRHGNEGEVEKYEY